MKFAKKTRLPSQGLPEAPVLVMELRCSCWSFSSPALASSTVKFVLRVVKAARIWIEPYFYEEVRTMTSKNVPENATKAEDKPLDESAPKAAQPSQAKRELTDDE